MLKKQIKKKVKSEKQSDLLRREFLLSEKRLLKGRKLKTLFLVAEHQSFGKNFELIDVPKKVRRKVIMTTEVKKEMRPAETTILDEKGGRYYIAYICPLPLSVRYTKFQYKKKRGKKLNTFLIVEHLPSGLSVPLCINPTYKMYLSRRFNLQAVDFDLAIYLFGRMKKRVGIEINALMCRIAAAILDIKFFYEVYMAILGEGFKLVVTDKVPYDEYSDSRVHYTAAMVILGFRDAVEFVVQYNVIIKERSSTYFSFVGFDRDLVTENAATFKRLREYSPYTGKGILKEKEKRKKKTGKKKESKT